MQLSITHVIEILKPWAIIDTKSGFGLINETVGIYLKGSIPGVCLQLKSKSLYIEILSNSSNIIQSFLKTFDIII